MNKQVFARNMRFARLFQGMTQKQLAEAAGIAVGSVSAYEKGQKVPPVDAAYRMAAALGVSLDSMFSEDMIRCPHCGAALREEDFTHDKSSPE